MWTRTCMVQDRFLLRVFLGNEISGFVFYSVNLFTNLSPVNLSRNILPCGGNELG